MALLASSGLSDGEAALRLCREGGNNRVVLVETGGRRLVAKHYYCSPGDQRDRQRAEWEFLSYAKRLGLSCVPHPISQDRWAGISLYEYVEGEKLAPNEVGRDHIAAAVEFVRALNGSDRHVLAATLPIASEACFSLAQHLAVVDRRIDRLSRVEAASRLDIEAAELIRDLSARWQLVRARVEASARRLGCDLNRLLPREQRCVSPSDFGFHNALVRTSGETCFIDFEYGGWDDPAKLAADFFCQPAVPVPLEHVTWFLDAVAGIFGEPKEVQTRANLLLGVLRTKWCCIMLGDFLPDSASRRRFADPEMDINLRKRTQLAKTSQAMQSLDG